MLYYRIFNSELHFKVVIILIISFWLLCFVSKIIFKQSFANNTWKNLFVFFIGFPTIAELVYDSSASLIALELNENNIMSDDWFYAYDILDFSSIVVWPLLLFFVAYTVHFILRVVREKRCKSLAQVQMNDGGRADE